MLENRGELRSCSTTFFPHHPHDSDMKRIVKAASEKHIVVNALRVSAVVGTLVNLINQGGPLMDRQAPSWIHVMLNYLMPYLVASYSAAKNEVGVGPRAEVTPGHDKTTV